MFLSPVIILGKWLFWHGTQKLLCQEGGNIIWGWTKALLKCNLIMCVVKRPKETGKRTWWWATLHSEGFAESGFQSQGLPVFMDWLGGTLGHILFLFTLGPVGKCLRDTTNEREFYKSQNDCLHTIQKPIVFLLLALPPTHFSSLDITQTMYFVSIDARGIRPTQVKFNFTHLSTLHYVFLFNSSYKEFDPGFSQSQWCPLVCPENRILLPC